LYWCFLEKSKKNNNSNTDINYFSIEISTTSPLPLKNREYIDIFSKSEVKQLPNHTLVEYTIDTGDAEPLYKFIYNLLVNELSIFRDNLEKLLEKGYI